MPKKERMGIQMEPSNNPIIIIKTNIGKIRKSIRREIETTKGINYFFAIPRVKLVQVE